MRGGGPAGVTRAGRRFNNRVMMLSDCVIERPSTSTVFNPETLEWEGAPPEVIYGGTGEHENDKCRIHGYQPQESTPDSGQHVYTTQRYFVSIPVGGKLPRTNDIIRITGCQMDPEGNIGRRLRVASDFHKTFATGQRLMVDEVTA